MKDKEEKDYAQIACDILHGVAEMGIMDSNDKEKIHKAISVLMYSRMYDGRKAYWISKKEQESLEKFSKEHDHEVKTTGITVSFTPTEIGNIVTVKCPYCSKEEDITDISSW